MGVMKIKIAPAMETEQIWSADQGSGFFAGDHRLNVLNSTE
jgi:hypothetical protein